MTRIIQPGRNAWRETAAEDSGLLVDAADYYRMFYRAAERASRYILMSGWQFDSGVPLLRGEDAPPGAEVRFLKFMNGLCAQRPALHVYLLAWDFHMIFAHEREWMQRVIFHWRTNTRFRFQFDDCPSSGGSHHQKFVVVDGQLAFLGGMDVCEARWDDRRHVAINPLRLSHGKPVKPYHDVQVYLTGVSVAKTLEDLFRERWTRAGGGPLPLSPPDGTRLDIRPPEGALRFGPTELALSRTDPRDDGETIREVEQLFLDAIDAAEQLIYAETQYFSSRRIYEALVARMREAGRARLDIVIVVNQKAEALKEEVAVGLRQAKNLEGLRPVATETGHALGLYYSLCHGANDTFRATYIHSKVMVVDDRFLTVGSANFTNRSMGVDSELHASWEAPPGPVAHRSVSRRIRRTRVSLLAEHSGLTGAAIRPLVRCRGLVGRLDDIAARPGARLQRHGPPTPTQAAIMEVVDPHDLPFDPEAEDSAGRDEPSDEGQLQLLAAVGTALKVLWRKGRGRSSGR